MAVAKQRQQYLVILGAADLQMMVFQVDPVIAIQLRTIVGAGIGPKRVVRPGCGVVFPQMPVIPRPVFLRGPFTRRKSERHRRIAEKLHRILSCANQEVSTTRIHPIELPVFDSELKPHAIVRRIEAGIRRPPAGIPKDSKRAILIWLPCRFVPGRSGRDKDRSQLIGLIARIGIAEITEYDEPYLQLRKNADKSPITGIAATMLIPPLIMEAVHRYTQRIVQNLTVVQHTTRGQLPDILLIAYPVIPEIHDPFAHVVD